MKSDIANRWYGREAIRPGMSRLTEPYVHPYFSANIWLIEGRDADLLVDFGMGLAPLAPALGRDTGKPLVAVATHAHVDHIGAFHEFDHRIGPARSASSFDEMPDAVTLAHLFRALPQPLTHQPYRGWDAASYRLRPAPLTCQVSEGDVIDIADRRFTVLELPGHSPDSIALFEEKTGLLIAGDAIYRGHLVDDLPGSDRAAYVETMRRLSELSVDLVLPGHNAPLDAGTMRQIAQGYIRRIEKMGCA